MDTSDRDNGVTPSTDMPPAYYPTIDDPLRIDIHRAAVLFDGRRVRIERREQASETIPLHLIAAVSIQHVETDDSSEPNDQLVVELTTGRTTAAGFYPRHRSQVQHWQDEVSRAVAGLDPTGVRAPVGGMSPVVVVLIVLVALITMGLFSALLISVWSAIS